MGHVEQAFSADADDAQHGSGRKIPPRGGVQEYLALAPADRDMRGIVSGNGEVGRRKVGAPVLLGCDERQDQLGMDAVGADQDLDALLGLAPVAVARDRTADPPGERKQQERQHDAGENRAEGARQPTDRRLSQRVDQSPFTSRAASRKPPVR